jgi:murein DD-endopeptidase MepM/ murein hydrolase activator NlpD
VAAPAPPPPPPPPQFVRPGTGRLTSGYGSRWGRLHAGIDLAAGTGAPISAVAAGTVVSAGSEGGYGRVVRLQHDAGTVTLYAHLSQLLVTVGQRVTAGTYVGLEGSSGHSTGPHLHFEVRVGDVPLDPAPWLRARGVDPAAP